MEPFPVDYRVYQGELVEDFMVTAKALKAPYLRVSLEGQAAEHADVESYPLVRIPVPFLIYPLFKGDKVGVYLPDSSPSGYWLYSVEKEIPPEILDNIEVPTGDLFTPPATDDTIAFNLVNDTLAIVTTRSYTIIRMADTISLISESGFYQYVPESGDYQILTGKYLLETKGTADFLFGDKVTTEAKNGYELNVTSGYLHESTGSFVMKSNDKSLAALIGKAFELISDLYTKMGTFDSHTHVTTCSTGPGSAAPTLAPTLASPIEADLFKAQNVDIFFQE